MSSSSNQEENDSVSNSKDSNSKVKRSLSDSSTSCSTSTTKKTSLASTNKGKSDQSSPGGKRDREGDLGTSDCMSFEESSNDSNENNKKQRKQFNIDFSEESCDSNHGVSETNESNCNGEDASSPSKKYSKTKNDEVIEGSKQKLKYNKQLTKKVKDLNYSYTSNAAGESESMETSDQPSCSSDIFSGNNNTLDTNTLSKDEEDPDRVTNETESCVSKRQRRRSYRSRLEEESTDEDSASPSQRMEGDVAANLRKRSSSQSQLRRGTRRCSGELRDCSSGSASSRIRRPTRDGSAAASDATVEPAPSTVAPVAGNSDATEARQAGGSSRSVSPPSRGAWAVLDDESVAQRVRRRRGAREHRSRDRQDTADGDVERANRRSPRSASQHGRQAYLLNSLSSSSNSNSDASLDSEDDSEDDTVLNRSRRDRPELVEAEIQSELKDIMEKKKPVHNFHITKEIINRQYHSGVGGRRRYGLDFSQRFYSSLHSVERLELMAKLEYHTGCVNAIGFSNTGSILVSGSDDLYLALWNWSREKIIASFKSGHRNNVFQCKFMPLAGDRLIATCARDGQVRLTEVAEAVCRSTRRLARHTGPSHKLAMTPARPQIVLSVGEDGHVKESDLRQEKPVTIAINTNAAGSRVPLYSIHQHPLNENQFCVAGRYEYVCVYDRRVASPSSPPIIKYCPDHLMSANPKTKVTCAVYSRNGDAIVVSYNDEDIYLFDTSEPSYMSYKHRYSGHRNNATVKGVNMFGPRSEYIMSGSDCGNVFIWNRETEAIVRCFPGDENGVVNVLEWHPYLPLLATSGLDSDIKVWIPSADSCPSNEHVSEIVEKNLRERHTSSNEFVDLSNSRMIRMILDHMRRLQYNRNEDISPPPSSLRRSNHSSEDDEDVDEDNLHSNMQCTSQ